MSNVDYAIKKPSKIIAKETNSALYHEMQKVKARGNFIFRQELKDITPFCNLKCSIICNIILLGIFIITAVVIISSTKKSVQYSFDYTDW
jgi:hypothetical protein